MSDSYTLPTPGDDQSSAEFDLMISGKPYLASDAYIQRIATAQRQKLYQINDERDDEKRTELMKRFFKCKGVFANMGPIFCEYVSCWLGDGSLLNIAGRARVDGW
jgi:hypothetical protein